MVEKEGFLKATFDFKRLLEIIRFVGIIDYLKFYLGLIIIFTGIIIINFVISELIINIILTFFKLHFIFGIISHVLLFGIFFLLMFFPFFIIFESRSISMIYNMRN
ncbi:hypothetical protein ALNOE001_16860 [Candidatus Methanobinarius endosymbioticus]|uniref:Uncharacterized protein n=1 Tax=Candidatus Methanobinarius endosymbioticus TaxID=2006182 RepID=A0A366MAQ2_9EURY|nr:hypothetical protein ALNOE001_16860 [Candidatus Methanobinarius endosymbioticus]